MFINSKMINPPVTNEEVDINLLNLFKAAWSKKVIFLASLAIGTAVGAAWFKLGEKRFSASISFVQSREETDLSAMGGLGALSMLGVGAATSDPPLLKFMEKYVKTREFILSIQDSLYAGEPLHVKILGNTARGPASDEVFFMRTAPMFKITKEAGLLTIKATHPDSAFALALANLIYSSFSQRFDRERRNILRDNLDFVSDLVEKSKTEMQRASGNMRIFLEQNRELGAPHLLQKRNELLLESRLAEEKYVQAEKERSLLEIKNEKKDARLVVIENSFMPRSPEYPKLIICMAVPIVTSMVLCGMIIAVLDRRRWITLIPSAKI